MLESELQRLTKIQAAAEGLAPEARTKLIEKHLAKTDGEVHRVLEHMLKYTEQRVVDQEFDAFVAERLETSSQDAFTPQEVSLLREEFTDPRSTSV